MDNTLAFMAVATLLVLSPGPNGILIAKTVAMSGKKAGFANIAGFVTAFYIHGSLAIFGISLLLVQSGTAFLIFKTLGAAYLIWLGIKALKNASRPNRRMSHASSLEPKNTMSIGNALLEGFLTNALNPKVAMFYLAAFPQFISLDASIVSGYSLVLAHSFVNLLWFSFMVITLSRVKIMVNNGNLVRWLHSLTGIVFIGFGAKLAFSKASG